LKCFQCEWNENRCPFKVDGPKLLRGSSFISISGERKIKRNSNRKIDGIDR